jgi:2,3-bisphosphoglycerate-dependent phosphoglycerate mutase
VGLSEQGIRDAEAMAPILALRDPMAIISSAMRRAVETATPIARACRLPLLTEPALHERRIGILCGQPYDALDGPWAETLLRGQAGQTSYATEGAESFDDIRDRILPIWHRLAERYSGHTYVIVTHGAVIKVLLLTLKLGFTSRDSFSCPNLRVHEFINRGGEWRLTPQ